MASENDKVTGRDVAPGDTGAFCSSAYLNRSLYRLLRQAYHCIAVAIVLGAMVQVANGENGSLKILISEVTFKDIRLTCKSAGGEPGAEWPRTNGYPPGESVLIEGLIANLGTETEDVRFVGGQVLRPEEPSDAEQPENALRTRSRILANLNAVADNSRFIVPPSASVPFSTKMGVHYRLDVSRDFDPNQTYYDIEIYKPHPMEGIESTMYSLTDSFDRRSKIRRDLIKIRYVTYKEGGRVYQNMEQAVDFYVEPHGWKVDGSKYGAGTCFLHSYFVENNGDESN